VTWTASGALVSILAYTFWGSALGQPAWPTPADLYLTDHCLLAGTAAARCVAHLPKTLDELACCGTATPDDAFLQQGRVIGRMALRADDFTDNLPTDVDPGRGALATASWGARCVPPTPPTVLAHEPPHECLPDSDAESGASAGGSSGAPGPAMSLSGQEQAPRCPLARRLQPALDASRTPSPAPAAAPMGRGPGAICSSIAVNGAPAAAPASGRAAAAPAATAAPVGRGVGPDCNSIAVNGAPAAALASGRAAAALAAAAGGKENLGSARLPCRSDGKAGMSAGPGLVCSAPAPVDSDRTSAGSAGAGVPGSDAEGRDAGASASAAQPLPAEDAAGWPGMPAGPPGALAGDAGGAAGGLEVPGRSAAGGAKVAEEPAEAQGALLAAHAPLALGFAYSEAGGADSSQAHLAGQARPQS